MFVQARLHIHNPADVLLVPDSALISNARGTQVAIVDRRQKVHFVSVAVGRDFGKVIEINAGLRPGDLIVSSPGDGLLEGESVNPVKAG
jgi:multidrug efflux pump subunit AcrA (membrane-fusion protein)